MKKSTILFVQQQLNDMGLDAGPADGILGAKTVSALDGVDGIPPQWSKTRKATAFIQILANSKDIDAGKVDGYWGPQTDFAFEALTEKLTKGTPTVWRPEDLPDANPNLWPPQKPQSELERFYGPVGQNQAKIDLPYPHKLAWKKSTIVNRFSCHEKVHDSLMRVLARVLDHYGPEEIGRLGLDLWGGCLNVRQIRGGTRYSTHSWGIALDYDPANNRLKWGRNRANFARPEYDKWWQLWEEEGWVSLGRARNFDWMHVQAAKI